MLMDRADLVHDRRAATTSRSLMVDETVVDDPYAPGEKIRVLRALRDDPLAGLHASKQIDDAMMHAGRHWQRAYELVEIGGARAIDPTKEAVDCGFKPPTISDRKVRAGMEISNACKLLGQEGEAITRDILGLHLSIGQTAAKRGMSSKDERAYIGKRFRECLETLAVLFGYASSK